MTFNFNYDMSAAPTNRRILALRESGGVGIVRWVTQQYHTKPRPYWADDRDYLALLPGAGPTLRLPGANFQIYR